MNFRTLILCSFALFTLSLGGCAKSEEGDTSPSPVTDPQTRANNAAKGIQSASTMTPEQKQAALDYMNQGAAGAQRRKAMAPTNAPGK